VDVEKATRSSFLQQRNGGAGAAPDRTAVVALLLDNMLGGAESSKTERGNVPPVATVEHCSAIPCHSMLWREVTSQSVLYFDIVFDVIACICFWGHLLGEELRKISEVHGRDSEGL